MGCLNSKDSVKEPGGASQHVSVSQAAAAAGKDAHPTHPHGAAASEYSVRNQDIDGRYMTSDGIRRDKRYNPDLHHAARDNALKMAVAVLDAAAKNSTATTTAEEEGTAPPNMEAAAGFNTLMMTITRTTSATAMPRITETGMRRSCTLLGDSEISRAMIAAYEGPLDHAYYKALPFFEKPAAASSHASSLYAISPDPSQGSQPQGGNYSPHNSLPDLEMAPDEINLQLPADGEEFEVVDEDEWPSEAAWPGAAVAPLEAVPAEVVVVHAHAAYQRVITAADYEPRYPVWETTVIR